MAIVKLHEFVGTQCAYILHQLCSVGQVCMTPFNGGFAPERERERERERG